MMKLDKGVAIDSGRGFPAWQVYFIGTLMWFAFVEGFFFLHKKLPYTKWLPSSNTTQEAKIQHPLISNLIKMEIGSQLRFNHHFGKSPLYSAICEA